MMIKEEIREAIKSIFQQYMCQGTVDVNITKELYDYLRYHKLDMIFLALNQNNKDLTETFEWRKKQVLKLNSIYK